MPDDEVTEADGGDFIGAFVEDFTGTDGDEVGLVAGLTAGRGASSRKDIGTSLSSKNPFEWGESTNRGTTGKKSSPAGIAGAFAAATTTTGGAMSTTVAVATSTAVVAATAGGWNVMTGDSAVK
jgi:hypothetical protein